MGRTLSALAEAVGGRVVGAAELEIESVRPLESAEAGDLSFLTSARYRAAASTTRASALLVGPGDAAWAESLGKAVVVADDPYLALAQILDLLHPRPARVAGVHPTAVVADSAQVDPSATIGPFAVVGEGARVGPDTSIGAHVVIGAGSTVGARVELHPHSVLYDGTLVGDGVVLHSGSVVGADGFGYATGEFGNVKMPQVGHVELAEDVEVGANSTIDRATLDATRIGRGTKIDNLVQVGHNAQIGENCIFCGQAGVSGSARIGSRVVLAGQTGVAGHLEIGDNVQVAAKSAVLQSVEGNTQVGGIPTVPLGSWRRQVAALSKLQDLRRRVRDLEKELERRDAGDGNV